jgi:hypothetical protein
LFFRLKIKQLDAKPRNEAALARRIEKYEQKEKYKMNFTNVLFDRMFTPEPVTPFGYRDR